MAESKLGTKHECQSCQTKFYDFGKPEKICPQCGADQEVLKADQEVLKAAKKTPKAGKP